MRLALILILAGAAYGQRSIGTSIPDPLPPAVRDETPTCWTTGLTTECVPMTPGGAPPPEPFIKWEDLRISGPYWIQSSLQVADNAGEILLKWPISDDGRITHAIMPKGVSFILEAEGGKRYRLSNEDGELRVEPLGVKP